MLIKHLKSRTSDAHFKYFKKFLFCLFMNFIYEIYESLIEYMESYVMKSNPCVSICVQVEERKYPSNDRLS